MRSETGGGAATEPVPSADTSPDLSSLSSTVQSTAPEPAAPGRGVSNGLSTLLAATAGCAAANIYYAQPLLTAIADTFHAGPGTVSTVVTAGTVGYTIGVALLVPLGDILRRRRLAVLLLCVVAVFQTVSALATGLGMLLCAALVVAVAATVSPLMVSFAATLAAPEQRGRVTGKAMSGVLLGVLLGRTVGGAVADQFGWRAVYLLAAVLALLFAVVLHRAVPDVKPTQHMPYFRLLGSVLTLLREEPALRMRCAYGFVSLAGFNALWTSMAFLLSDPPYSYTESLIGLFGLAGAVGAVAARITGRLADRGAQRGLTGALLASIIVSWLLMWLDGGGWLIALVAGVIVLDFGVQGMQVANLSVIYQLRPEARSRLTTAYMTFYFLGGTAGSAASGAAYARYGWNGVCLLGTVLATLALALWVVEITVRRGGKS